MTEIATTPRENAENPASQREALVLYSYWRSSSSWRVRIALAHKGLSYRYEAVPLLAQAQRRSEHLDRNGMGQIPVLEVGGAPIAQSMAILAWLEQTTPQPALLPAEPLQRARAIALAELVNAGIQPLQNLAVLKEIEALSDAATRADWGRRHIEAGLLAFEREVQRTAGIFSVGDAPSWADLALVPQLYNARRFGCDLTEMPTLNRIELACVALPAFVAAHPDQQPDAPTT